MQSSEKSHRKKSRVSKTEIIVAQMLPYYLATGNATEAARQVLGPMATEHRARWYSFEFYRSERMKEEVRKARERIGDQAVYDGSEAMKEAKDAMEFALSTKNANAYVKAVELRAKLQGLLVERHDVRSMTQFTVTIAGLAPPAPTDPLVPASALSSAAPALPPVVDVPPEEGAPRPHWSTPEFDVVKLGKSEEEEDEDDVDIFS